MTDRELMQQALDAMLNFSNDISDEMFESIRSLSARLAQPDQEPVAWTTDIEFDYDTEVIPAYKKGKIGTNNIDIPLYTKQPQQTEQKPIAWRWKDVYDYETIMSVKPPHDEAEPLYAAPPQREWQGLTEAERVDILDAELTTQNTEHFALAQAIEAKLKEKNT